MMSRPAPVLIGVAACAAALLLALAEPKAALAGWLVGFVYWGALPIGALALVMMMRLIPGGWDAELAPSAEAAMLLMPLAALAALPILVGVHALYGWADAPSPSGFRAVYLTPGLFALRSMAGFAVFTLLAVLLLTRRAWSTPVASAGLIVFTLLTTMLAVDWLMSLDPEFHSSGFGLYVLSIQMTVALVTLIVFHLLSGDPATRLNILGGLLLTVVLLWAYFAFMQYFIIWSGNLPHGVMWYQRRGTGIWSAAEYTIAVLHLAPAFLLFFPDIRGDRRWLLRLSLAVLAGKALECLWLVLPAIDAPLWAALLAAVLSLAGLGLLSIGGLSWAFGSRADPAPSTSSGEATS